jgi:hypothetical protein
MTALFRFLHSKLSSRTFEKQATVNMHIATPNVDVMWAKIGKQTHVAALVVVVEEEAMPLLDAFLQVTQEVSD